MRFPAPAGAWRPYAGLVAFAVLLGPVHAWVVPAANDVLFRHDFAADGLSSAVAGLLLLLIAPRSASTRNPGRSRALAMLLSSVFAAAMLRSHAIGFLPHRDLEWGATAALSLASPLWLASLAAAQLTTAEVPRVAAGAAIAGIGTVFLVLETAAYAIEIRDAPALVLGIALAVFTVYAWGFAAPRLRQEPVTGCAARFLLLQAAFQGVLSIVLERTSLHGVIWRDALILLGLDAALTATATCLWFWLLKNLQLSAFTFHPLAIWTASLLGGILTFGLANWRMDIATLIALAALWFGVRARTAGEQPIALELR